MASSAMNTNDKAVIIDLNLTSNKRSDTKNFRISCSGTFLDYSQGYLITNGLILTPFLEENAAFCGGDDESQSWAKFRQFLSNLDNEHIIECNNNESRSFLDYIESHCEITVYVESGENKGKRVHVESRRERNPLVALASRNRNAASNDGDNPSYRTQTARLLAVWRCESLNQVLHSVLSQTNSWSFVDAQDVASNALKTVPSLKTHSEEQARTLLPFFVLLKIAPIAVKDVSRTIDRFIAPFVDSIDENFLFNCFDSIFSTPQKLISYFSSRFQLDLKPLKRDVSTTIEDEGRLEHDEIVEMLSEVCKDSPRVEVGSKLNLVSTPFGSLSPSVFLNSVSEGIVTNVAGEYDTLIMTDARCVPGCEGGALYVETKSDRERKLIGIVVAPFCWRQNEWVGLTFACSLRPLLMSLLEMMTKPSTVDSLRCFDGRTGSQNLSALSDNVALVKIGSRWGSAVVVDLDPSFSNERILLTCCHVVQKQTGSKVRVRFTAKGTEERFHSDAVVLYATPLGQVYDIAVLRVDVTEERYVPKGLQLSNKFVNEGDRVHVVGHGLFDDHVGLPASVTSGVISKVLYRDRKQVLIQSTCAVHPGVSGGALVNAETNQLSGVVVCNARDAVSGACYPHINLSIPSTILQPVLQHFRKYRDTKIFQKLHDPDPTVNSYWQLGYNRLDKINSKL